MGHELRADVSAEGVEVKLAFLSRSSHEAVIAAKDAHIAVLERVIEAERELTKQLMAAARASEPVSPTPIPVEPVAPQAARKRTVVDAVIQMQARDDVRLGRYLRKRERVLRGEHPQWTDQQIATELSRWETAEEMPPEFIAGGEAA